MTNIINLYAVNLTPEAKQTLSFGLTILIKKRLNPLNTSKAFCILERNSILDPREINIVIGLSNKKIFLTFLKYFIMLSLFKEK